MPIKREPTAAPDASIGKGDMPTEAVRPDNKTDPLDVINDLERAPKGSKDLKKKLAAAAAKQERATAVKQERAPKTVRAAAASAKQKRTRKTAGFSKKKPAASMNTSHKVTGYKLSVSIWSQSRRP